MAIVIATPAAAGLLPAEVQFSDSVFNPGRSEITAPAPGQDEAIWTRAPGSTLAHSIRQDDRLFRSGPPRGLPFAEYHADLSAGSYHYYCEVHGSRGGGMDGVIRVRPYTVAAGPDTEVIVWGDAEARKVNRYLVQFRAQGGKWKTWKQASRRLRGTFGARNRPIDPKAGKAYQVRVRSFVAKHPDRRSAFSPPVTFFVDKL